MFESERALVIGLIVGVLAVGAFAVSFAWYSSSIQAEVWQREGVNISRWEVFMGAKPVDRNVRISDDREKK